MMNATFVYCTTVKVWSVESGGCVTTLAGHSYHVFSVSFPQMVLQLCPVRGMGWRKYGERRIHDNLNIIRNNLTYDIVTGA